jgi:DNA ligase (NAD+)|tara:strand:- start:661 stop:891 length:231 start_codon:yes stop_codon:yes gene_type:complete
MNLQNLNIVITGTLSQNRCVFEKLIEAEGGTFKKSISNSTDMLILGEKPGKSKISKAKDLNVQVISEADLINKIYH